MLVEVQQLLFEEIVKKLGNKQSLAEFISESLNVSSDSAYRRISGKTALTFSEAVQLSEQISLSFDTLLEKDRGTIAFERRTTLKTENDIAIHLKEMAEMMKNQIAASEGKAIYTTKDIPVFYHFYFPELGAFKIYCWHRALNSSAELNEPFNPSKYIEAYSNLFSEIKDLYCKVPAVEIWSEVAILGFIRQLKYYFDSGLMGSKETALLLLEQHSKVFEFVKEQARKGRKLNPLHPTQDSEIEYDLYFNELFVMDNSAFANLNGKKVFFNSYANFNFIPTQDQNFCNDVEMWLNNQMKRSVKLSLTREKERSVFFRNIQNELDALAATIKES